MPWITNSNGEKVYKSSIFMKEELPTWDELYEQWWKGEVFYSCLDDEKDVYYNIPRSLVLMGYAMNQLNKMLHEDGMHKDVLEYARSIAPDYDNELMNKNEWVIPAEDTLAFCLVAQRHLDELLPTGIFDLHPHDGPFEIKIATLCRENSPKNPFLTDDMMNNRFDLISLYNAMLKENEHTTTTWPSKIGFALIAINPNGVFKLDHVFVLDFEYSKRIVEFMLKDVAKYYENGIGWKDENGNLIESEDDTTTCHSGFDPAL